MRNRASESRREFFSELGSVVSYLKVDAILVVCVVLISWSIREVFQQLIGSAGTSIQDALKHWAALSHFNRWAEMAAITSFAISVLAWMWATVRYYLRTIRSNAKYDARQVRMRNRKQFGFHLDKSTALTYLAGIVGFSVFYALFHRALVSSLVLEKLFIYASAFALSFEMIILIFSNVNKHIPVVLEESNTVPIQSPIPT